MSQITETETSTLDLPDPTVDVAALGQLLMGRWADIRRAARVRASRPELRRIPGQSMADHRERALTQLHLLAQEGSVLRAFPKHLGGQDDAGGNIAPFEEIFLADPSLQIKAGVQWGLFAAAIMHLGTERHHDALLPG